MNEVHTYPMKKHMQVINRILGFWAWLGVVIETFPATFFKWGWAKKVTPAYRKMMAGKPESYLQVSAEGLIYRVYPTMELRCTWEDVNYIKRGGWLGDILFLHRAEKIGALEFELLLGKLQVHLSSLEGWPDGGLKDDLRKYAPQLFKF